MDCHSHWHAFMKIYWNLWDKPLSLGRFVYVSIDKVTSHFSKSFSSVWIRATSHLLPLVYKSSDFAVRQFTFSIPRVYYYNNKILFKNILVGYFVVEIQMQETFALIVMKISLPVIQLNRYVNSAKVLYYTYYTFCQQCELYLNSDKLFIELLESRSCHLAIVLNYYFRNKILRVPLSECKNSFISNERNRKGCCFSLEYFAVLIEWRIWFSTISK